MSLRAMLSLMLVWGMVACKPASTPSLKSKGSARLPDNVVSLIQKADACAPDSFRQAIAYMEQGLALGRDSRKPQVEGLVLAAYGELWRIYAPVFSEKREALRYFQLSNNQFAKVGDTVEMAKNHYRIGLLLSAFQDYENASEEFLKAESLFNLAGDEENLISLELEFAGIFLETGEWERASTYGGKAYDLALRSGKDSLQPKVLNTIGQVHLALGHHPVALEYFLEGMDQAKGKKYHDMLPDLQNNAGKALLAMGRADSAGVFFQEALTLSTRLNMPEEKATSFQGLAHAASFSQNWPLALTMLDSSTRIARQNLLGKMLLENYQSYIQVHQKTKELEKALAYSGKLFLAQDSLNLLEEKLDLVRIDARYGFQSMEDENYRLLDNEKLLQTRQLLLIFIGLLLLAMLFFLYIQYRGKKKINERLNALVDKRTEQLRIAYAEVVELNRELDIFAYRTAHDIRGPVARLLGLCELVLPIQIDHPEVTRYMRLIYNEAKNMDFMLLRFLEVNHIKHVRGGDEPIDLSEEVWLLYKDMLNKGLDGAELTRLEVAIPPQLKIKAQPKLLEIVLKNLLMNSINFRADQDAYLYVKARLDGNYVRITCEDNGKGIAPEVAPRIFEMFYRGSTSSKGLGLGLYAAQLAVQKMGGSIRMVQSQPGHTEFLVTLPYIPA